MKKIWVVGSVLLALCKSAWAQEEITFDDGVATGNAVSSFYQNLGMTTPNLRFHDSSVQGNVPFNFVDDWGAVVNFGRLDTTTGFIIFTDPVDFVEIDALAQGAFDLDGELI